MIKVYVDIDNEEFTVTGHAGYAEHGKDILCSAVSALVQHTVRGILLYSNIDYRSENGYTHAQVKHKNAQTGALITSLSLSLRSLSVQYPDFIEWRES